MDDQTQGTLVPEHSQITINGVDYAPEDLQSSIELANKTRELEKTWNTPFDSLASAYGKSQTELTALRKEKETWQSQVNNFERKQEQGTDTEADLVQAKEAARKLGITLNEDLEKSGYVKKDDIEKIIEEREAKAKAIQSVLDEASKLEKEIDGSDGRPKFNKKAVLAYAQAYKFDDLQKAYEDMHDGLKEWKQAQVDSKKNPSLKTFKPSGVKKEPSDPKVTSDNARDLLRETLWGSN